MVSARARVDQLPRNRFDRTCRIRTCPFVEAARTGRGARPAEETEPDMTSTTQTRTAPTPAQAGARQPLWKHGLAAGVAAVMARTAGRPRSTFVRTALVLTALSFVPDLTFGFDAPSAATLITLHATAAAIVIPTLARRLAVQR
jgi:hypothetical protein